MPKKLLADLYQAELEDLDVKEVEDDTAQTTSDIAQDQAAPEGAQA
jgi:hypothetical protein